MNPGQHNKVRKAPKLAGSDVKLDDRDYTDTADEDDEDDRDVSGMMMDVICLHPGGLVKFHIDGHRYKMREGDVVKIPAAYASPVQYRPQSDPLPSVVERETGRKVLPLNDARIKRDPNTGEPLALKAKRAREDAKLRAAQGPTQGA